MFSNNVQLPPSSELMKELRKWEQHHTRFSIDENGDSRPGNPYVFRPFPKMLYRATTGTNGQVRCLEVSPEPWLFSDTKEYERACAEVEALNKRCQLIVEDEGKERIAKGQGWCETQAEAVAQFEREQQAISTAAAEAAYQAQRMSGLARAEFDAAQTETHEHVVDVQGGTKRHRGRPRKAVTGTGVVEG